MDDKPSTVITPQRLQELEALSKPLEDSWYLVACVALCSLNQTASVCSLFQYVCAGTNVPHQENCRRSQRIRDTLIKTIPAIGLPKVLNSLQAIGSSDADSVLGSNALVSNRRSEWATTSHELILARGRAYVGRLHGDERVLEKLDDSGTADLAMVVGLCYGFIISETTILDATTTSLAFLAALITQDIHPQIEAHSKGALRNCATKDQIEATQKVVERLCQLVNG